MESARQKNVQELTKRHSEYKLMLERLIIDLRRDVDVMCLEQLAQLKH